MDLARSNLKTAEIQHKIVTENVKFEVKKTFYKLLATEEKLKIYENFLESMDETAKSYRNRKQISKEGLHVEEVIRDIV